MTRYDSLKLFTPARYIGLPGGRFPGKGDTTPTKDAMADYMESYVARFALPVELKTRRRARAGARATPMSWQPVRGASKRPT